MTTTVFIVLLLLSCFLAYKYQRAAGRYRPVTDEFHHLGGNSVALSSGRISYQWHGPENGEKVVLAHGFATAKFVWDKTIPALTEAGFRVLIFDHFGRGYSDRPRTAYNREFYINEIRELLDKLDIREPVNLVGYSMGGAIVTCFAATYPERVKQLILLAPAGFVPQQRGAIKLLAAPFIGEKLLIAGGADLLLQEIYNAVREGKISEELVRLFKQQFYIKGTPYALTSTIRHFPMQDLSEDFTRIGELGLKMTAVWGDRDSITPIAGADKIRLLAPQLKLHVVKDAGHDFAYTRPEEVNPPILATLQAN